MEYFYCKKTGYARWKGDARVTTGSHTRRMKSTGGTAEGGEKKKWKTHRRCTAQDKPPLPSQRHPRPQNPRRNTPTRPHAPCPELSKLGVHSSKIPSLLPAASRAIKKERELKPTWVVGPLKRFASVRDWPIGASLVRH